jgi:hypothetical protein
MKNFSILIMCFVSALASCGQRDDGGFPPEIKTIRLESHVNIPGTRIFFVIPEGFKPSTTLPAIEKNYSGMVQVVDAVGKNFYTDFTTFSREKFEENGIKVFGYQELKVNGFAAKMILSEGLGSRMYNLVFGDSTFSATVIGSFITEDTMTREQIKQAMLSIYYDKSMKVDSLASVTFNLDDTKSIFKFADFAGSIYMYTIDGVRKKSYENVPFFMAHAVYNYSRSLEELADGMANLIEKEKIENISESTTNGLHSFKRKIYGKINGRPALLFQHIVLTNEMAVVMQGIAYDNFERNIAEFENLSGTINKK